MKNKKVFVFGNPDIATDSVPLSILSRLREKFPDISFLFLDPNEEWGIPDPLIIIDTIVGIPDVRVFHGLLEFSAAPTVSVHDFDALFNLRYLEKLGKLGDVIIIGISPKMSEADALIAVSLEIKQIFVD